MKYVRTCLAAVLGAGALVEFLFCGGAGVGFTILFLTLLAAYYIACGFPKSDLRHRIEHTALVVLTVALALCYTLFANETLRILNFLALMFLMGLVFLQGTVGKSIHWDRPLFHAELWLGYFVRPFICLAKPWKDLRELRSSRKKDEEVSAKSAAQKKTLVQVLVTVLAAIPLLFILISILSSSDPVFRDVFKPLIDWLSSLQISEVIGKIILFLFLMPFTASAVWSYRDSVMVTSSTGVTTSAKVPLIPSVSAITVLAMVNAVYLLYAGVQFAYLFGAFGGNLPDGLTPAEYARQGFFELAFISCINVVLLLLSIRMTLRNGKSGTVIRCLATSLLALSSVQLVSAMLRMRLYVRAFGYTQLRYFVSAFMILIAVYFIFLLVREFVSAFPLFRCMIFAGAAALVILNYTVPDAQIARYNIEHYLSGDLKTLDIDYIILNLSADGKYILYLNKDALTDNGNTLRNKFDVGSYMITEDTDQAYGSEDTDRTYRSNNWKMYNLGQEKLYQYLRSE